MECLYLICDRSDIKKELFYSQNTAVEIIYVMNLSDYSQSQQILVVAYNPRQPPSTDKGLVFVLCHRIGNNSKFENYLLLLISSG